MANRAGPTDWLSAAPVDDNGHVAYVLNVAVASTSGNTTVVQPTASNLNAQVVGNAASAATDSGNPVKIAGVFNTTAPTFTNAQRGDVQITARGEQLVAISQGAVAANVIGTVADGLSNTSTGSLRTQNLGMRFNGTTWDRDRKPNATSRIVSAAASTNATSAKASAGDLYSIHGYNAAAAPRFLKVYNKASAPTVGTDTPVMTFALAAGQAFDIDCYGHYFSTGIAYALTVNAADADTTALTAGDIVGMTMNYA